MKILREYVNELNSLLEEYGDLPLYTADDDEGNGYTAVSYMPSVYYVEELRGRLDGIIGQDDKEDVEKDLGRPLQPILVIN